MERLTAISLAALAILSVSLLLKAAVIAWNLWFIHARPALYDRIYDAYTGRPVRATLIGAMNSAAILFVILVMLQSKPLGLFAILLAAGLCVVHLWGRTACYRVMAERLGPELDVPPSFRALVRAAAVTELAFLVPVLGQVLFLGTTMRCAGALIMAVLTRRPKAAGDVSSTLRDLN